MTDKLGATTMHKRINQQVWQQVIQTTTRLAMIPLIAIVIATTLFATPAPSVAANLSTANLSTADLSTADLSTTGLSATGLATDQAPTIIAALQSTPFEEQPATLISPREGAPIALYIRPAPNQQPVGYGISGDPVTVTDQFGDYLMEDDPSATWSHIRLNNAPYTEGWLRGSFLSMDTVKKHQ